jgi:polysaccharide pyruvyl transferase WcaK-like protein
MTKRQYANSPATPRVGLFGLLGSGNIGNDASTDVIVRYLRTDQPNAVIDAMCMGWERLRHRYDIETVPIQWQAAHNVPGGPLGAGLKAAGKLLDIFRTVAWVRRHDVVIVPGMGIMEAALPINPWGVPWSLFLLAAAGKLLKTKVALVAVGASPAKNPVTAYLFTSSARLAYYRSFRDPASREVLRQQGLDSARDPIYPDLVFNVKADPAAKIDPLLVGVGVMDYHGDNEDRDRAEEIHAAYVASLKSFVRWLIDSGRSVQLFTGDQLDQPVVDELVADIRMHRPDVDPSRVQGDPISTFPELTRLMAPVSTVVATRFHNVLFALLLGKPTISIGYSPKNDSLMDDLGLAEYKQHAKSLDVEKLKAQITDMESRGAQIKAQLSDVLPDRAGRARAQLDELNTVLFGGSAPLTGRQRDAQRDAERDTQRDAERDTQQDAQRARAASTDH